MPTLPQAPGVYQMYDDQKRLLYVGKAARLRTRVASYFRARQAPRIAALVRRTASIETTVTANEADALLLECNLIKQYRPPFNILLRDDKSYPYLLVSADEYPRLSLHRGPQRQGGKYFGPYTSTARARQSMDTLQRLFRVRPCENSVFRNRSRPCLQYQIGRCKAPCVGLVGADEYRRDVRRTLDCLGGREDEVIEHLMADMERAASAHKYEQAARCRDQIAALRAIQAPREMESGRASMDVLGVAMDGAHIGVHLLLVRRGRVVGSRSYAPRSRLAGDSRELLQQFIPRFYLGDARHLSGVSHLLVPEQLPQAPLLADALSREAGHRVQISRPRRGLRRQWLMRAQQAAAQNLAGRMAQGRHHLARLKDLGDALGSPPPQLLECYDISHTQGAQTVASCVVFDGDGARRQDWRRFNIKDGGGDDCAALAEAVSRRFARLRGEGRALPQLVLVDGGRVQLARIAEALAGMGVGVPHLLGIAKGEGRRAALDCIWRHGMAAPLPMDAQRPAMHLLQRLRDEAHRSARDAHRRRRSQRSHDSVLEQIPGVGAARRRLLLQHFGGLQALRRAPVAMLARIPGIGVKMAEEIHRHLQ